MVRIKQGVDLSGITRNMWHAVPVIGRCFLEVKPNHLFEVTGGCEYVSHRGPGSQHYSGNALDFGVRGLTVGEAKRIGELLRSKLGRRYDVVVKIDHIHVEYDPWTM